MKVANAGNELEKAASHLKHDQSITVADSALAAEAIFSAALTMRNESKYTIFPSAKLITLEDKDPKVLWVQDAAPSTARATRMLHQSDRWEVEAASQKNKMLSRGYWQVLQEALVRESEAFL